MNNGYRPIRRSSSTYTYHTLSLQRTIDIARYNLQRSSSRVTEVNQLQFCPTGDDLHAAQAICNHFDAGDAYYATTLWQYAYRKYSNGLNIQLAELICPPHSSGIDNCRVNILPDKSYCPQLYVSCMKVAPCYRYGNSIYSRRYRMYGQICDGRSNCRSCFRCRTYQRASEIWNGYRCMSQRSAATGQEIWEPHFKTFDGRHFNFQGQCSYYQVKLDEVSIIGSYEVCGEQSVTCLTALDIRIGKTRLVVGPRSHFEIIYEGEKQPSKKPFCNRDLCFYEGSDLHDVIDLAVGIKIIWDRKSEV